MNKKEVLKEIEEDFNKLLSKKARKSLANKEKKTKKKSTETKTSQKKTTTLKDKKTTR